MSKMSIALRGDRTQPFPLPARLSPALLRIQAYWSKLKRAQADIPFADDVKLGALGTLSPRAMLVDVLPHPVRFRIALVGKGIVDRYGKELAGLFVDEIAPRAPLDYLNAQSSATLEKHRPTYFRTNGDDSYERLLLPLWGDGHISAVLAGIVPSKLRRRA